MLRVSRLFPLFCLVAGLLVMSACAPRVARDDLARPEGGAGAGAVEAQPVAVALLAPSSAPNVGAAQLGQALVNAARLASGELDDPLLDLRVYDTGGDAARAAAMARQAVADGAQLILGPLFGASTEAVASTAARNGLNVISFSTDSTVAGGPVFLSGFLPEMAARRIAGYARGRGYGPLGVFYPETDYGRLALRGVEAAAGPALVAVTGYPRTEAGIPPAAADFARRAESGGARGLVIAESGDALKFVVAELTANGLGDGDKFLGLGEWNTRSTLETPGLMGSWFPAPDPAAMKSFVEKYQRAYGDVPPSLAVLGYDGVMIAAQLLGDARREGTRDPFSRGAIGRPQGFRGAVGPIRFHPNGLGERGMAILEVGRSTFRVIDPVPVQLVGAGV